MKAVIIYGPPGAGKGTQANLLAVVHQFVHFDTGKFLEQVLHDPRSKGKLIDRERKIWDSGILNTPSFVLKDVVSKITKKIANAGLNIAFSGSPRTIYEAFGNNKTRGLISLLEKLYGKESIYVILLQIKPSTSIKRNSDRFVCSICGLPVLSLTGEQRQNRCFMCGGALRKRILDNPKKMKIRLGEYRKRTVPIMQELMHHGYKIYKINGERMPFTIFQDIKKILGI